MDDQAAQQSPTGAYPNPYVFGANSPAPAPSNLQPTLQPTPVPKKSGTVLAIILLIVGLVVGGAGGYFGAQFLVFGPERTRLQSQVGQLQTQVGTLQQQVSTLQVGTGNSGTTDTGTATWKTYTNAEQHFSFKYPTDFEVRTFQSSADLATLNDKDVIFAAGIFKPGESAAAGMVFVYKGSAEQGPTHDDLFMNRFPGTLPTPVLQKQVGAGFTNDVGEVAKTVNNTQGSELSATQGQQSTPTPGGVTYKGYLFDEQFKQSYLTSYCSSDQSTQRNLVGCLFLSTFTFIR